MEGELGGMAPSNFYFSFDNVWTYLSDEIYNFLLLEEQSQLYG